MTMTYRDARDLIGRKIVAVEGARDNAAALHLDDGTLLFVRHEPMSGEPYLIDDSRRLADGDVFLVIDPEDVPERAVLVGSAASDNDTDEA